MKQICIKIAMVFFVIISAVSIVSYADSTLEVVDDYIQREEFKNMFEVRGAASSVQDAGDEIISGADGSVSYHSTDLSLRGKGDIPLELKRRFSSNTQYDASGSLVSLHLRASYELDSYRTTNKYVFRYYDSSDETVYVAFDSPDDMLRMENGNNELSVSNYASLTRYGFQSYYSSQGTLFYSLSAEENEIGFSRDNNYFLANDMTLGTGTVLTRDIGSAPALLNLSSLYSYYVTSGRSSINCSLSYGWSYDMPVFQRTGRNRLGNGDYEIYNMFYDPIDETSVNIEYDYYWNKNNDRISMDGAFAYSYDRPEKSRSSQVVSRKYSVEVDWRYYDDPTYIYITREDGIKYTIKDNQIISAEDKYGNKIRYNLLGANCEITDTLGRQISIIKTGVTVNGTEQLKFEATSENNPAVDPNNHLTEDDIITYNCKKALSENDYKTTAFKLRKVNTKYYTGSLTQSNGNPFRPTALTSNYIIDKVILPGGGQACYKYSYSDIFESYRPFVEKGRYVISERYELSPESTAMQNRALYSYQVVYENPSETHKVISTVTENITYPSKSGFSQKNIYDKHSSLKRQDITSTNAGNSYYVRTDYTYSDFNGEGKRNMLTMNKYAKSSSGSGAANTISEVYQYDSLNRLTKITRDGNVAWYCAYGQYNNLAYEYTMRDTGYYFGKIYNYTSSGKYITAEANAYTTSPENTGYRVERTSYTQDSTGDITYIAGGGVKTNIEYAYTTYDGTNPTADSLTITYTIPSVYVYTPDSDTSSTQSVTKTETYDYLGRLVSQTDGNGNTTQYQYDKTGRNTKVINPDNTFKTIQYDDINNAVTVTDETNRSEKSQFDSLGRFTAGYKHDGSLWKKLTEYVYDNDSRVTEIKVLNGDGTEKGKVKNTYYSDGSVKNEYVYNGSAVISRKDFSYAPYKASNVASTAVKLYSNSANYALVERQTNKYGFKLQDIITYDDKTFTQTYTTDMIGNLKTVKDFKANAEGLTKNSLEYTYDHANRILTEAAANGTVSYTYSETTGLLSSVNDKGITTAYGWNAMGLLQSEKNTLDSQQGDKITYYYYDTAGNNVLISKTAEYDTKTGYKYSNERRIYDSRGRMTASAVKPENDWIYTRFEYDDSGRLLQKTEGLPSAEADYNANEHKLTSYEYDTLGNMISETDPMGNDISYTYNLMGQLISKTDKNGTVFTYSYDVLNRLLNKSYTDSSGNTDSVSYTYNMLGKILSMVDNSGTTYYNYDKLGNLLNETKGNTSKTYTYDANGNRTSFNLKIGGVDKQSLSYTFNDANQLVTVNDGTDTTTYTYQGNLILNETTKSGSTQKKSIYGQYNNLGLKNCHYAVTSNSNEENRIKEILTIRYYPDGSIKSYSDNGAAVSFTYDNLRRITSETRSGEGTTTYTYDKFGNMASKTSGGVSVRYSYDKNNRLLSAAETNGDITDIVNYTYDANGNMLSSSSAESEDSETAGRNAGYYSYDGWNRLTSFTSGGITAAYVYNGDNLRQRKTVTENGVSKTVTHAYDGMNVAYESDGTNESSFIRGNNLISTVSGSDKKYYILNHRGDVVGLFNSKRQVTSNYNFDAFGNQKTNTADSNPFRYCGEYYDNETGFIYLRNRYYDPSIGRFTTEDPVKDGDNWYAYCGNNPVNRIDPNGCTDGQITGECGYGGIYDTSAYVNDKYKNGWVSSNWGTLEPNVPKFLMKDLETDANNCVLTAITRVFAYYRDNYGKDSIPDDATLYSDIKAIAEGYGYSNETGTFPTKINNIINDTFKKYGYEGEGKSIYVWDFNTVKTEIDAGRPLLFNIAFGYYGDHTVSVVGYSEFTRSNGWFRETKRFIKVYDGWTQSNRYIDYDLINIGSFSTAKFE